MKHPQHKPRPSTREIFKPAGEKPPPMKNHHHNGSIHGAEAALVHATIAAKAYEIWERDGCPEHRAEATWLEAERDLLAVQKWNQSSPSLPVSF